MQSRAWSFIFSLSVLLLAGGQALAQSEKTPPKDLSILRVTPTGDDVPASRQIVIEFNRPVVAVGKMERTPEEGGVTITPPLSCQWRWLNTSSLSCNLDDQDTMSPATRYTLSITPQITAQDGARIAAAADYSFMTQRPAVSYTSFKTWRGPGSPVIRVILNQPVSKTSLEKAMYVKTSGSDKRIKLLVTPDEDNQKLPDYLYVPGEKKWIQISGKERTSDDQKTDIKGEEARRVWLVEPEEELPLDTTTTLSLDAGLVSAQGPETNAAKTEVVTFDTYPEFGFAGIRCMSNNDNELFIYTNNKPGDDAFKCNPLRPVSLAFTSPVLRSQAKDHVTFSPDLAGGRTDFNPWGDENRDWSGLGTPHRRGTLYYIGLPVGLKAANEYTVTLRGPLSYWEKFKNLFLTDKATVIEDEMGRSLQAPVSFMFSTDHRNPNFEMPYNDAVLESTIDSEIPLYVNNLTQFAFDYRSLTTKGLLTNKTYKQDVKEIKDIQYAVPLGARTILGGKSGAFYGRLSTTPEAPNKWDGAGRLFAQVTPWQAHLKLGHFSSLVWVTDMATGAPVKGVKVRIYPDAFTTLTGPHDVLATAITDDKGMAELPGSSILDPNQSLLNVWQDEDQRLFVMLDKGEDMAVLPLASAYSLSTWSFSNSFGDYNRDKYGHLKSWGFTAQGIYRAGDTMQYKIFLRNQNDKTLIPPPANGVYNLEIVDPMGNSEVIEDIKFSKFGAYEGEYPIPESASVGWYEFKLIADFTGNKKTSTDENTSSEEGSDQEETPKGVVTLTPMSVLVSDFTPAPFRVTTELNGTLFRPGDEVSVETRALLHSGGPYGDASARATITLKPRSFSSDHPEAKDFAFGTSSEPQDSIELMQKTEMLDDKGEWTEKYKLEEQSIYYGKIDVESAVQDDRGKSVASVASADYAGVDRLVGLKSPQWFYESKKPVSLKTIVVDEKGVPAADTKVKVLIEFEEISVAKVKGAGNAYLSDMTREWKEAATCENTSAATPTDCVFTPKLAGTYRATATIADTKGRSHTTEITLWVSGDDYVQWNDQDNLALSIIPEKKEYKVGDTAKFLVKNPYPGAMALITVERYGIIDRIVKTLDGSTPVIEIPVKADYMPGFYLSVLVVSPRVDQPVPELGQVDMGKPGFRMGYVRIPVKDPYKEIGIDIKVAQEVYRPGDTIKVDLQAKAKNAPEGKEPVELAIAVLDESVFDLISAGRGAFDPYAGFYDLEPLDMRNYSLLYRLIGKQKFEKKGANAGGDGGADVDMRTLFKYVSYWNPSVMTDAEGRAQIEFKTPDNLTGWRVLAIATTPGDRMGLGEGNFKVNRPTEIRPVMPNQIHEGDSFAAGFSVMNRTDAKRTLEVTIDATGDASSKTLSKTEMVTLEPYKRVTVYLPLEASLLPINRETPEGSISFTAKAGDATDGDGTVYTLPVLKKRSTDVAATYGTTTENKVEESIAFPEDIYTDTGDISVVLSPSVISNLTGAFRYMRDYPYLCWEQIMTQAVMAAHYQQLKPWIPDSFVWKNSSELPQKMLDTAANFQAPNGGMAYFVATDERADPYLSAYTALAFTWLKQDGYKVPADVESRLQAYLLNFLKQDAAPDFYQPGMTSTVRAVALAALAKENKVSSEDVIRYRPHLKEMSLFGKTHFMQAALLFEKTQPAAKEAAGMIFAAGSESGGKFIFSETLDDGYVRLLSSTLRDNCAVLSGFLDYKTYARNSDVIGDKPFKLVRSITQSRGSRDHWENTQENMFCMNALVEYAKAYESVKPDMTVTAKLDDKEFGKTKFADVKDTPVTLTRPITPADPGKTLPLALEREGDGRLYYAARLRYAAKDADSKTVNAGMDIRREYSIKKDGIWTLLKGDQSIKRGDTVRVDLYLSLPTARNYVVVNDPLPGALETVNRDLATASGVDDEEAQYDEAGGSLWFKYNDWTEFNASFWSFYHKELRNDSARFYADRLPAGNYHLSYMTQAIADGSFAAPPVSAEEMYDPDIYGRGLGGTLVVKTDK